jgi:hypothetical protein
MIARRSIQIPFRLTGQPGCLSTGTGRPDLDILGSAGEMAYGKAAGLTKAKDDPDKTHELGSVHVRTVLGRNARLIIRPSDPSGAYVLADTPRRSTAR